ncbi:hypothetical protein [Actinoplanes sp. NPDC051494]|uniref:hypothetical protein n=1 Tax=Actinoplanes sp. NPDC051494 TaxID=3363907 RepID=UPI0037B44391
MRPATRHELHHGFQHTRTSRLTRTAALVAPAVPAFGCLGGATGALTARLTGTGSTGTRILLIAVPAILAVATVVIGAWTLMSTARMGATLAGNRLTVRWFRTRSADLGFVTAAVVAMLAMVQQTDSTLTRRRPDRQQRPDLESEPLHVHRNHQRRRLCRTRHSSASRP